MEPSSQIQILATAALFGAFACVAICKMWVGILSLRVRRVPLRNRTERS